MIRYEIGRGMMAVIVGLLCAGCAGAPTGGKPRVKVLRYEVSGLPEVMTMGSEVSFKVKARNEGREMEILPTKLEVELGTAFQFVPADETAESGGLRSGDQAISRNAISIDPPHFDHLVPGGFRVYHLKWKPDKRGKGTLRILLPPGMPEVAPQPVRVR